MVLATIEHLLLIRSHINWIQKHDPYLLKLQLDLQLKRQVAEETYLQEAFINLQSSGLQLEKLYTPKSSMLCCVILL